MTGATGVLKRREEAQSCEPARAGLSWGSVDAPAGVFFAKRREKLPKMSQKKVPSFLPGERLPEQQGASAPEPTVAQGTDRWEGVEGGLSRRAGTEILARLFTRHRSSARLHFYLRSRWFCFPCLSGPGPAAGRMTGSHAALNWAAADHRATPSATGCTPQVGTPNRDLERGPELKVPRKY